MKKMSNKKGFTLMEMLIVVAIIAILVAIAIPTFSSALNKAKIAADIANVRAAYAETVMEQMTEGGAFETNEPAGLNFPDYCEWTVDASGVLTVTYNSGSDEPELSLTANPID